MKQEQELFNFVGFCNKCCEQTNIKVYKENLVCENCTYKFNIYNHEDEEPKPLVPHLPD